MPLKPLGRKIKEKAHHIARTPHHLALSRMSRTRADSIRLQEDASVSDASAEIPRRESMSLAHAMLETTQKMPRPIIRHAKTLAHKVPFQKKDSAVDIAAPNSESNGRQPALILQEDVTVGVSRQAMVSFKIPNEDDVSSSDGASESPKGEVAPREGAHEPVKDKRRRLRAFSIC